MHDSSVGLVSIKVFLDRYKSHYYCSTIQIRSEESVNAQNSVRFHVQFEIRRLLHEK